MTQEELDRHIREERESVARFIRTFGGHPANPGGVRLAMAQAILAGAHRAYDVPPDATDYAVGYDIGGEG